MQKSKTKSVKESALSALSRREHSISELARKLLAKGFESAQVAETVTQLQQKNWLSDERFVEVFVRSRQGKYYGPLRIRQELQQRGIAAALIAQVIDTQDKTWLLLAQQARQKRFGEKLPQNRSDWLKQAQFLRNKGFTPEQIRTVLKREISDE